MKAVLSVGTLIVLLSGIVPAHAVHAWFADGPICNEGCSGTDDCCCRKRQQKRELNLDLNNRDDVTPTITPMPPGQCCPYDCTVTTACQRPPFSKAAFRAELNEPAPDVSTHAPERCSAPRRVRIPPSRPRAPPA